MRCEPRIFVATSTPLSLSTWIFTPSAPLGRLIVPLMGLPPLNTAGASGTDMVLPIRLAPVTMFWPSWLSTKFFRVADILVVASNCENCANWATKASFLTGSSGSWFFSWVVNRVKKSVCPMLELLAVMAASAAAAVVVMPVGTEVVQALFTWVLLGSKLMLDMVGQRRVSWPIQALMMSRVRMVSWRAVFTTSTLFW